ncbi:glb-17 [Pristionchus pacificus]|uniref:Glb-17 n=1 Tax=Pristionchus pacificus TaxID=54126 RepID=A0A2A6C3W4_PRIPA|nr:glb-17 [Pristionchus pacificus]|eukprot:PDM72820.1 glb-17 [Pristionchus pacificus]
MDVSIRLSRVIVATMVDPRFQWNVSASEGIREIAVKSSAVWQPDVYPCESAGVTTVTPETISALVSEIGNQSTVINSLFIFDTMEKLFSMLINSSHTIFDVFPFDKQRCLICFALDGFTGSSVNLMDTLPDERQLRGNSEWDFVGNLSIDDSKTESDGLQTNTITYHFLLARRPFFYVYLIVVPSCLICIISLVGIFFTDANEIVENAVSIGLTTLTSLMLLVTIFADSLAKTNNLSGLGWFVLMDIVLVYSSVTVILIIDHTRTFVIEMTKKKRKEKKFLRVLLSNNAHTIIRVALFFLAIFGLVLKGEGHESKLVVVIMGQMLTLCSSKKKEPSMELTDEEVAAVRNVWIRAKTEDIGKKILQTLIEKRPKFAEYFGILCQSDKLDMNSLKESKEFHLQAHRIQNFLDTAVGSLGYCPVTSIYDMAHRIGQIHFYRGVNFGADNWLVFKRVTVDQVTKGVTSTQASQANLLEGTKEPEVVEQHPMADVQNPFSGENCLARLGWNKLMTVIVREMKRGFLEEAMRNCREEADPTYTGA